jgi:3',5'-cyclic AMP phosphodiesterase CpdA
MTAARPFVLAQVSDLHIRAGGALACRVVDTTQMLRACVRSLLALERRPDAVVLTGDLADAGSAEEYAALRELIAPLSMPVYLMPGNHDEREALRAAFPEHAYLRQSGAFVQYAIEDYPLRIVALDTLMPGASGGELCEERLGWLDRMLARVPEKPTAVFMHHPPFRTHIGSMDKHELGGREALVAVIRRHPQVQAILCGHVHRPIETRFAGTLASTAPSAAHQIRLDLDVEAPGRLVMEPPAYRLHAYAPDTGLVSHTAFIGEFAGPYPLR